MRRQIKLDFIIYIIPLLVLTNGVLYHNDVYSNLISLLTTAALLLVNGYVLIERRVFNKIHLVGGLGIGIGFINTLINGSGFGSIVTYANLLMILMLSTTFELTDRKQRKIIDIVILSIVIILWIFSDQIYVLSNYYSIYPQITAEFLNPNTIAVLYLFLFLYVSIRLQYADIKSGIKWLLGFILLLVVVDRMILAGGRASMLSLFAYVILSVLNLLKKCRKKTIVKIFRTGLLFSLVFSAVYVALYEIMDREIEILGKNLFSGRQGVWREAYEILSKHWLWGYTNKYAFTSRGFLSAHNSLLAEWFTFGLIPLICCISCLDDAFKNVVKQSKGRIAIYAIVSLIPIMTFEAILSDVNLYYYYAMLFMIFPKGGTYDTK